MEDLKAQLKELETRQGMNDCCFKKASKQYSDTKYELKAKIADLKQQIADSEVTYSIGDRFNFLDKEDLILARIYGRVGLVELSTGKNWGKNYSSNVEDCNRITSKEMRLIWNGNSCTRYWDARKQEKC